MNQLIATCVVQHLLVVGQRQAHFAGDVLLGRCVAKPVFQFVDSIFDIAQILAAAARHPVGVAQFVEHRAAYPLRRIGFKLRALAGIEIVGGFHQADHPGLDQVVDVDAGRHPGHEMVGDALDQRRELPDAIFGSNTDIGFIHECRWIQ